jgi:hypothetical protein
MPDASFPELMAELAWVADIADLAIKDDRYACLSIDETFTLHLRFDESTNEVYLFSLPRRTSRRSQRPKVSFLVAANVALQNQSIPPRKIFSFPARRPIAVSTPLSGMPI